MFPSDVSPYFVMIPFYHGLDHLHAAIDSVMVQSDPDWRLVVVDDSPDDAGAAGAAALIAQLDEPRVTYVRNDPPLGVAGNFEQCMGLARLAGAELVVLLHADDELEPTYVAAMRVAHAARPHAACIAPQVTVIDADGRTARTLPDTVKRWLWPRRVDTLQGDRGLALLMRGQFFWCPAVSYRLPLVPRPAWDDRFRQVMDLDLYARVLLEGGTIVLELGRHFRYRRHEQSMTQINSSSLLRSEEETALCREVGKRARELGWRRASLAVLLRPAVRLQALMRAALAVGGGKWEMAHRAAVLGLAK